MPVIFGRNVAPRFGCPGCDGEALQNSQRAGPGSSALVVEHEAFDDEFPKLPCGPYAEMSGNMAFDPVGNGDNHVEV